MGARDWGGPAANEIRLLGHFPDFAIMPGTSIIEAIGKAPRFCVATTRARHEPKRIHGAGLRKRHEVSGAGYHDYRSKYR